MSQVLELAKQGDTNAIAALINRSLTPQGIKARVMLQNSTLKVLLESLEVPDKSRFTSYIIQGLRKIEFTSATALEIFGKQSGSEGYAWTQSFQMNGETFTPMAQPATTPGTNTVDSGSNDADSDNPFLAASSAASSATSATSSADTGASAKQGNLDAIEAFVKSALSDREGLESFVELENGVLKITIETKQFLDGPAFCGELGQKLNQLASETIREAEIYKRKNEKAMPFLMKKMTLHAGNVESARSNHTESNTTSGIGANQGAQTHSSQEQTAGSQKNRIDYSTFQNSAPNSIPIRQRRPEGVTIIAYLYYFLGGLTVVLGLLAMLGTSFATTMAAKEGIQEAGQIQIFGMIFGIFLLVMGGGRIFVAYGLMKLKAWALLGAYVIEVLSLLDGVWAIVQGTSLRIGGIILGVRIFMYLLSDDVRSRFE